VGYRSGFNLEIDDSQEPDFEDLMGMYSGMAQSGPAASGVLQPAQAPTERVSPWESVSSAFQAVPGAVARGVTGAIRGVQGFNERGRERQQEMFGMQVEPFNPMRAPANIVKGQVERSFSNILSTPVGSRYVQELLTEGNLSRLESFLDKVAGVAETVGDSREMYEADEWSARLAQFMIDSGAVEMPSETSGVGGRPLMMDVARELGFNEAASFGVEALMPAFIPSLGVLGAAGIAARPGVGAGRFATTQLREVLERLVRQTPELSEVANTLASQTARSTSTVVSRLPEALRADVNFMAHLDDVQARYASTPTASRTWQQEPVEIWTSDVVARDPETGMRLRRDKDTPNGLSPGEHRKYMEMYNRILEANGNSKEQLEANLLAAAARAEGNPAAVWYPQQAMLNRIQDAAGDDIVGRALFEHLNDYHGTYSARSKPPDQALRATWNWLNEMLGVPAASELNLPIGMGSMPHSSQASKMTESMLTGRPFNKFSNPKTFTYRSSLNGNLGDIVADIHYARTMLNDPSFDEGLSLGSYLAMRDLGVEVANKNNMLAGDLQQRAWVGNADFTNVGGAEGTKPEPFDVTANNALDIVLDFIAAKAGLTNADIGIEAQRTDILSRIINNDPSLAQYVRTEFPHELLGPAPDAASALVRTLNSDEIKGVLTEAADAGRLSGISDFLTSITDTMAGFRLLPPSKRPAQIETFAQRLVNSGALNDEQLGVITDQIVAMTDGQFERFANSYLNLRRNLPNIRDLANNGGFSYDLDFSVTPLIGKWASNPSDPLAQAKGYAAAGYPMLGRVHNVGDIRNMTPDDFSNYIVNYMFENAEMFGKPRHGIGGWVKDGQFHLDVTIMTGSETNARAIGQSSNQMSITRFHGIDDPTGSQTLSPTVADIKPATALAQARKEIQGILVRNGLKDNTAEGLVKAAKKEIDSTYAATIDTMAPDDIHKLILDKALQMANSKYGIFIPTGGSGSALTSASVTSVNQRMAAAREHYKNVIEPIMLPKPTKLTSAIDYKQEIQR
jgi:hypothetical protein